MEIGFLAECASLAYTAHTSASQMNIHNKMCSSSFFSDNVVGSALAVFECNDYNSNKSVLVFAFRGTDSWSDWRYNLSVLKRSRAASGDKRFFVPRVHSGFDDQWLSLKNFVSQKLMNVAADTRVFVTGHSLGGALACLCAHWIATNLSPNLLRLCTFGAPRPGNWRFKRDMKKMLGDNMIRVVYGNDIVTYTPFVNSFHVGKLIELGVASSKLPNVSDHGMSGYVVAARQDDTILSL